VVPLIHGGSNSRVHGVMRKFDRGVAIPIATLLVFLLVAWLGVAGPIVSDAQGKGAYEFVKEWQTLIAALIALLAGGVVAHPLWRQLAELQRQADQRSYETLRQRSIQLSDERALLVEVGRHMELAEQAVSDISRFQIVIGIQPGDLARLDGAEAELAKRLRSLQAIVGRAWGTVVTQHARLRFLECAQHLATSIGAFDRKAVLERRITQNEVTDVLGEVSALRKQAVEQAQTVLDAIRLETERTGRAVAELERRLW
jgi:hypothetical protein